MTTNVNDIDEVELAQQLRVDAIRAAAAAGSGHPTSSMSAADLLAVLVARVTCTTASMSLRTRTTTI